MDNYNKFMPEKMEQALKNERIADREIRDTENYRQIGAIMGKIECMRRERKKDFPELTQEKLAEKAGIALATYTGYLSGRSDNLKVKTLINIANVLRCKLSDLMDERHWQAVFDIKHT